MSRPKPVLPKPVRSCPPVDAMSEDEERTLRADLEFRLNQLRANINAKRRARGMIEIDDGVWIMPDQRPPGSTSKPASQPCRC